MAQDMAKRVEQFVRVRDMIKEMKDKHAEELRPLQELKDRLDGILTTFIDQNNLGNGFKTPFGTCYKSVKYSATLADPDAFMNFVTSNNLFELLDRRANSTAVQAYVKAHNTLPTGCNLTAMQTLNVRRANGS